MKDFFKDEVDKFLKTVADKVSFKEARSDVQKELSSHIYDNYQTAKSYGLSDKDATIDSIKRMGDPEELGRSFELVHKPSIDAGTISIVTALCLIGLFTIKSSGFLMMQAIWMTIGLIAAFFITQVPFKVLRTTMLYFYPVSIIAIALAHFSGVEHQGQPYLSILNLNIKVIDLSSILMAISVPAIVDKFRHYKYFLTALFGLVLLPVFYFVSIGSTLPAILFLVASVLSMGTSDVKAMVSLLLVAAGTMVIIMKTKTPFLPLENIKIAATNESHTDFALLSLFQTSKGMVAVLVVAFVALITRFLQTSPSIKNQLLRSTTITCITILVFEILVGLFTNFGLAPMFNTGINIPFISYGGSLAVAHIFMIGLVLACLKRKSIQHFA